MSGDTQTLRPCEVCGATIYPEHLQQHTADRVGGRLLCPHCLREGAADSDGESKPSPAATEPSRIHGFNTGGISGLSETEHSFKRGLLEDSPRATRCKVFQCKMTEGSLQHLNEQINDWVDAHENVEIKFANTNVGAFEGKGSESHMVVTLFY